MRMTSGLTSANRDAVWKFSPTRARATRETSTKAIADRKERPALQPDIALPEDQAEIQIVDHQVEDHGNVEAARAGRAIADAFHQQRAFWDVEQAHGLEDSPLQVT